LLHHADAIASGHWSLGLRREAKHSLYAKENSEQHSESENKPGVRIHEGANDSSRGASLANDLEIWSGENARPAAGWRLCGVIR